MRRLKGYIVQVASTASLRQIAMNFELKVGDRRKRDHLEQAIKLARQCTPETLLSLLTEQEVKQVCDAAGIEPRGRKTALIERLLSNQPSSNAARPQETRIAPLKHSPSIQSKPGMTRAMNNKTDSQPSLGLPEPTAEVNVVEKCEFDPIKGYPMLNWRGKRPFTSTRYYPAQLKEAHGEEVDGWRNKIYWGDNLQVMSHLLRKFRGKIDLVYIDPPFDSKADYRKSIKIKKKEIISKNTAFEDKQYSDIWSNDEYLQFMYERLILIRELLSDDGAIYLHCDYRKAHELRCLLDEIFGKENFMNSIVWAFSTRSSIKTSWKRSHHDILFYKKSRNPVYNWNDEMVIEPLSEATIKKYRLEDDNGRYRLNGRFIKGSPIKGAKDVDSKWEKTNPSRIPSF